LTLPIRLQGMIGLILLTLALGPVIAQDDAGNNVRFVAVDIQPFANLNLNADFHTYGNNMKILPRGRQKMGGVEFEIGEKYIHLAGKRVPDFPEKVEGIVVNRYVNVIYFLQGSGWGTPVSDGVTVGEYVIHYDDSTVVSTPIVYGRDIRDWWVFDQLKATRAPVVWTGLNHASKDYRGERMKLRLLQMSWLNPNPKKKVAKLDFVSFNETVCSPFLIAASAELTADEPAIVPPAGTEHTVTGVRYRDVMSTEDPGQFEVINEFRDVGAFLAINEAGHVRGIWLSGPGPRSDSQRGTDLNVALASKVPTVQFLDLANSLVTNDGLDAIRGLSNLRSLNLNLTSISDKGLETVCDIKSLERLWLHETKITNAGLAKLVRLPNLKVLDLSNTNISDSGLTHLEKLTSLEELDLRKTKMIKVAALRRILLNTRIKW